MSLANTALLYNLGLLGTPLDDDLVGGPASTQVGATPVKGELARCTTSVLNGSFVLKQIQTGEASPLTYVVNDSANAIKVFPHPGEAQGGVANASLTIPAGQSAIFVRVPNSLQTAGADWRSAVIP
ncbi:MAG TPA: hypothetical protein VFV12_08795 [Xanthobacteraceae bacterium]|nr:hypothetical protein [Xanthobacteraceae bacterium]